MIWLSIIIPTFNGEKYLTQALESVRLQGALGDVECIIVDDGSSDETINLARKYQDLLPLQILKKVPDKNWVSSTNLALEHASGNFICFLHQDDLWLPGRLERLREYVRSYPELDCFTTDSIYVGEDGRRVGCLRAPLDALPTVMRRRDVAERLMVQNFIAIPAPIFKRSCLTGFGCLDASLWYTADWDLWMKLATDFNLGHISVPTVAFRIHGQSQTVIGSESLDFFQQQMDEILLRYKELSDFSPVALRAAKFSVLVNVALAGGYHGEYDRMRRLLFSCAWIDFRMLRFYFSYSCIFQRIFARMRAMGDGLWAR